MASNTNPDDTASPANTPVVGYKGDPSRLRPPSKQFQCRERLVTNLDEESDDYGAQVVAFECTIEDQPPLLFYCREPSCGVLTEQEPAAVKEDDGAVDPSFFDAGYTLAGKTGFQVWPGSRLVVESLVVPQEDDGEELRKWQQALPQGLRVLELGSGVGLVGGCLAQAGAQVLLTDLPTLVTESLQPNLQRNSNQNNHTDKAALSWLSESADAILTMGKGWVSTSALDWTVPVNQQLSSAQCQIDLIIASDCVWLVSMLEGLLNSVQAIFQAASTNRNPKLFMSFQRRDPKDGTESQMFTTVDRVLTELQARKWKVECLAWHPVVYEVEGVKDETKEVFLFLVEP